VTPALRNALLTRILVGKETIKDAWDALDMKYPTAKNVVKNYRLTAIVSSMSPAKFVELDLKAY
jgi:hypothetical protein